MIQYSIFFSVHFNLFLCVSRTHDSVTRHHTEMHIKEEKQLHVHFSRGVTVLNAKPEEHGSGEQGDMQY